MGSPDPSFLLTSKPRSVFRSPPNFQLTRSAFAESAWTARLTGAAGTGERGDGLRVGKVARVSIAPGRLRRRAGRSPGSARGRNRATRGRARSPRPIRCRLRCAPPPCRRRRRRRTPPQSRSRRSPCPATGCGSGLRRAAPPPPPRGPGAPTLGDRDQAAVGARQVDPAARAMTGRSADRWASQVQVPHRLARRAVEGQEAAAGGDIEA